MRESAVYMLMIIDTLIQGIPHDLITCEILECGDITDDKRRPNEVACSDNSNPVRDAIDSGVRVSHHLRAKSLELFSPGVDMSTLSQSNMLIAAHWLGCCLQKHKVCTDCETKRPIPYRAIDISNPESPVLALGSEKYESYVTLS